MTRCETFCPVVLLARFFRGNYEASLVVRQWTPGGDIRKGSTIKARGAAPSANMAARNDCYDDDDDYDRWDDDAVELKISCHVVSIRPLRKALELDGSNVTLQAMAGITSSHINPNNFEKMRVPFAFQVFGDKVLNALRLYETELERNCGSIQPVLIFFGMIRDIMEIMASRFPRQPRRPDSASEDKLLSFLTYLTEWELHAGGRGGFLSALLRLA
ncbi:hypothetical protein HPB50_027934 [Hyalomma asiaticum]|nr:hypothetical protein HPB50_027934 [Hyalomma asiaticum]